MEGLDAKIIDPIAFSYTSLSLSLVTWLNLCFLYEIRMMQNRMMGSRFFNDSRVGSCDGGSHRNKRREEVFWEDVKDGDRKKIIIIRKLGGMS